MRYKGVIFDMDGILFDTERIYQDTWREIAADRDIELPEDFVFWISGTSGPVMLDLIQKHYHVEDGTEIRDECMQRVRDKLLIHVPVKPGVYEILQWLKEQHVKTAVASSSLPEQIRSNLQKADMEQYFDEVVSGTEVKNGKPAPDIFLLAAERIGLMPEECCVFEDSANGVKAGHAAGCTTIMIPDMIQPSEETKRNYDAVYESFRQVLEAFQNED